LWSEAWQDGAERLQALEALLQTEATSVSRGGDYDRWDLQVRGGLFGTARLLMAIEEHGAGKQLIRCRLWPKFSRKGCVLSLLFATLTASAAADQAWVSLVLLGAATLFFASRTLQESGSAMGTLRRALRHLRT
jgi:hypothetical protein